MAYEYPAASDPFDEIMDRYRCREVDGLGSRCQLVVGHPVEHILERDGRWLGVACRCPTTRAAAVGNQLPERRERGERLEARSTAAGSLTGDGCWLGARAALTFPGFQRRPHMAGYPGTVETFSAREPQQLTYAPRCRSSYL